MVNRREQAWTAIVGLASTAVVLAPFAGASETYAKADRSEDYEGRRALEAVATEAGSDATVIHHRSPLWYMNLVEERRRDIKLLASFHLTLSDREIDAAKAALETGLAYVLYPSPANARLMREAGLSLVPVETGMLYEIVPRERGGGRGGFVTR